LVLVVQEVIKTGEAREVVLYLKDLRQLAVVVVAVIREVETY
jgi:hypothetical protein